MKKTQFNDNWLFWPEDNAFALVWSVGRNAKKVMIPHDAMLEKPAHEGGAGGGNSGYRDGGTYYYSKEFIVTPQEMNQDYILEFDGVYMNAQVYVNTQLVASHPYGFTRFFVPLNEYLASDRPNEIRVIVRNNAQSNCRWYSGGGIYRDVYLHTGARTHIKPDGLRITTSELTHEVAKIDVDTDIVCDADSNHDYIIKYEIYNEKDQLVASSKQAFSAAGGECQTINTKMKVNFPHPWTVIIPTLYRMDVKIYNGETLVDETSDRFGIRTLYVDSKVGLLVNGMPTKLKGACIHMDNGIIGAADCYDANYRKIKKLKEAGYNAVRMAHNPSSEALLRACDEVGMYVMEEAFDMWTRCKGDYDYALFFEKYWEEDVEAMVRNAYNHPSVIMYSIGNEIPEIGTKLGAKICAEMTAKIKSIDTSRFTTAGINGVFSVGDVIPQVVEEVVGQEFRDESGNVNDFLAAMFGNMDKITNHRIVGERIDAAAEHLDIVGYNYMTPRYLNDTDNYPERVIVGSETYPGQLAQNWGIIKNIPAIIGDFSWTGFDYLGEAGAGIPTYNTFGEGIGADFPCQLAGAGDFDITGARKPGSYLREIIYGHRSAPYISVQRPEHFNDRVNLTPWGVTDGIESWSFFGHTDEPIRVEVFSAGDEVGLFINNNLIEKKPAGESVGFKTVFETKFEAGSITAVSYQAGEEIGRMSILSANEPCNLFYKIEEGKSGELVFIDLSIVDYKYQLCTEAETLIEGELKGEGELYMGSSDYSPLINYTENKTMTKNGRAQAIIRKPDASTSVILTVTSEYGTLNILA